MRLHSVPKYQQMADNLRQNILNGKLPPGTRLKTDEDLGKEYGINKRTVANGMAILVAEGLISRTPRRGTIVERSQIVPRSNSVIGVMCESSGDLFEDIEKEITQQALKKDFYPLWVPQSLFTEVVRTPNYPQFRQFLEHMVNDKPYGLIVRGERFIPFDLLERNRAKVGKLVFICQYLHHEKLAAKYVLIDYNLAARQILNNFAVCGHKKITFVATALSNPITEQSRSPQQILLDALNSNAPEYGIEIDNAIPEALMQGQALNKVVKEQLLPHGNTGAILGIDAIYSDFAPVMTQQLGEAWRKQFSFVGFFNTTHARKNHFSSIDIQPRQIAQRATAMLFEDNDRVEEVFIPTKLVNRGSILIR